MLDQERTAVGIRSLRWDADKGFFLNAKPFKIQGTCNHQDFAGLGVALPDRVHYYKVEKLKEMGSNALRFSHQPMAPELLDACDRLGMVVMDENRRLGDSSEILGQVESLVRRDRNHPSVILVEHVQRGRRAGHRARRADVCGDEASRSQVGQVPPGHLRDERRLRKRHLAGRRPTGLQLQH